MTSPSDGDFPALHTDVPSGARLYDYGLGGKNNFPVDRVAAQQAIATFPELVIAARNNRKFLYRAVRFLARDAGIRQFLDMGSGLPTEQNVHQVAQLFQPEAHVVYVDNDPMVLAHGRALLATDRSTTVIQADMADAAEVMDRAETRRLLDFAQPVAVLFLSTGHFFHDGGTIRRMLATVRDRIVPGSYMAFTQVVGEDEAAVAEMHQVGRDAGFESKIRLAAEVEELLRGWEPVEPGFGDVTDWRPDPAQPELAPIPEGVRHLVEGHELRRLYEFGGVVRRT